MQLPSEIPAAFSNPNNSFPNLYIFNIILYLDMSDETEQLYLCS